MISPYGLPVYNSIFLFALNLKFSEKEANTVRGYDFRACVPYVKKKGDSIFTGGILIEQSTMTIPSCLKACGDEVSDKPPSFDL